MFKSKKILKTFTLPLFVGCFVSGVVIAHGGATGIIKERMDMMDNLKSVMQVLVPMMRGDIPYNAEEVTRQSNIVLKSSGAHLNKLFPKGSLDHPSEAKADIWIKWESFQAISNDLNTHAQELSKTAIEQPGNLSAAKQTFGKLAKTCSNCHADFRIKR